MVPPLTINKPTTLIIPPNRHSIGHHADHMPQQLDIISHSSSSPTPFFMSLYHSPPTPATIRLTSDGDGTIPSLTPVLSSSASTTSTISSSSSSCYSTTPSAHDAVDSILPHEHFYSHLQTNTSLLRIVLRRSLPATLMADQWHRLKLEIRDEFGMTLEGERAKASTMHLTCELLEQQQQIAGQHHAVYLSTDWKVDWRPLHYDAWESIEDVSQTHHCSGFNRSGTGGLEFIITHQQQQQQQQQQQYNGNDHPSSHHHNSSSSATLSSPPLVNTAVPPPSSIVATPVTHLYVRVIPTFGPLQTIQALPLVVGPFTVIPTTTNWGEPTTSAMKHGNFDIEQQQQLQQQGHDGNDTPPSPQLCSVNAYSQNMYRAFHLAGMKRYFIIKEGWDLGTPGKMWDSALMISDLFIKKIIQQSNCLENCHLLDLSAGTGVTGLLIYFVYKHMFPEYHQNMKMTLTDLPEALPLIHYNQRLNGITTTTAKNISVAPLRWGKLDDIWRIKKTAPPIDVIIASDVLYEPSQFAVLMKTLILLAEPGRTVVYLGYKRRGLKACDEQYFFDLCCDAFDMQAVGYNNNDDNVVVTVANGDDKYNRTDGKNGSAAVTAATAAVGSSSSSNGVTHNKDGALGQVGWEKRHGKLVRNSTGIDGEGWLGSHAMAGTYGNNNNNNITRSSSNNNNENSSNGVATQTFEETGVQIYRLIRK